MGNICRSPMAWAVCRKLAADQGREKEFEFDAAGTDAYHIGQPMDERAKAVLQAHHYPVGKQRCRQVKPEDFERFDWILTMDRDNLDALRRRCPVEQAHKLRLFLSFSKLDTDEVPDPYYGDKAGFERVLQLCEAGARGFLASL